MEKIVKVAYLGERVKEVAVTEEMTVERALAIAGYSNVNGKVTCQGERVELTANVNGFDSLIISPEVKGGR